MILYDFGSGAVDVGAMDDRTEPDISLGAEICVPQGVMGAEAIRHYLPSLPELPGVYRMLDANGDVLYVGKAKALKRRVASYTRLNRQNQRILRMIGATRSMVFVTTRTEAEALLLEANYIKRFRPPYNVILRDDKSFPYILLRKDHAWPQILKHRGAKGKAGEYYGPFASTVAVNQTLNTLQKVFLLRSCSDAVLSGRTRPCLLYQVKRCSAPCVGKISGTDYAALVAEAQAFLSGKATDIRERMAERMTAAAEALAFEEAAAIRDRLRALGEIQATQTVNAAHIRNADIVALQLGAGWASIQLFFYRQGLNWGHRSHFMRVSGDDTEEAVMAAFLVQFYGNHPPPEKLLLSAMPLEPELVTEALRIASGHSVSLSVPKRGEKAAIAAQALANAKGALERRMAEQASQSRLLEGVASLFDLDAPPQRIEVYDNSHLGGTQMTGGMIAAGPGGFLKSSYRKFNIRGEDIAGGDDFAMMREVFRRRFTRLVEEDEARERGIWPDLVLIDGGPGQLSAVLQILEDLGIADVELVAISKGVDRNAGREWFHRPGRAPFQLPVNDPVLFYLQRLRDEAHRFVIGAQRKRRTLAAVSSALDDVPGIGPKRKRALLHYFGSAKAVKEAQIEDLLKVEGISAAMAEAIHGYFRT